MQLKIVHIKFFFFKYAIAEKLYQQISDFYVIFCRLRTDA